MVHSSLAPIASGLPNIHDLPLDERADLMRLEWEKESRFQREFGKDAVNLPTGRFTEIMREQVLHQLRNREIIAEGVTLEELHLNIPQELKDYDMDDGVNRISTYLYDTDEEFTASYLRFVKDCLAVHFPYPFYFQATPTVRLHCPEGKNSNHYPRYHSDIGYGHPPQEINLWLPLTAPAGEQRHGFRVADVASSRSILEPFGYNFAPFIDRAVKDPAYNTSLHAVAPQVDTGFGFLFAFDSRSIHTGEPLLKHTRASIDVRIIPVEDFNKLKLTYQGTGRRKIHYAPGAAYYHLPSDQL